MTYFKNLEMREAHPGWAIKFEDGTWLGGAHGYIRTGDAFSAYIYDTKEQAEKVLDFLKNSKTESEYFSFPSNIVEAWQPACENLRAEVLNLKQVNVVGYLDLHDLREELEAAIYRIKGWEEKGKEQRRKQINTAITEAESRGAYDAVDHQSNSIDEK